MGMPKTQGCPKRCDIGNNLVPRAFPSVHVKSLGTNFASGNYELSLLLIWPQNDDYRITLQDDINLLSKGKGFSRGKCLDRKFILFILATKKYYFVLCVDLLLEKYRVEFYMWAYIDWCILKRPVTRAVIKRWGPEIFPRLL